MRTVLLLGAGFSRNWGGWLATEAFEYLLGSPHVDTSLATLLWKYYRQGGFENALAEAQQDCVHNPANEVRLRRFEKAISEMFSEMDRGFAQIQQFEPQNFRARTVATFLARFDAIFTLNQNLLLERHYVGPNRAQSESTRWRGHQLPGIQWSHFVDPRALEPPRFAVLDPSKFTIEKGLQPFFKLHGSSNWYDANGRQLLVMGGQKALVIRQHPVLNWYHEMFVEQLMSEPTRLMVIGYSFGDDHINLAMRDAVLQDRGLRIFVIDPIGIDAANKSRDAQIPAEDALFRMLKPAFMGASRRSLREIFGTDAVEHAKVMRFFE